LGEEVGSRIEIFKGGKTFGKPGQEKEPSSGECREVSKEGHDYLKEGQDLKDS